MQQFTLFTVLLFTPFILNSAPHDEIVTSIVESDYQGFIKIYNNYTCSTKEVSSWLDLANKMISVRHDWMVKHYRLPVLGEDLFYAALWGLGAALGFGMVDESTHSFEFKRTK